MKSHVLDCCVQRLGRESSRRIKDEEGITLYRCLCCVWLRALFSSGRLRARIKVRGALYADLSRNRPRRHATLKTHSAHNLLVYRNKPAIKHTKSREYSLLTSDVFSPRSVASQVYYFPKHLTRRTEVRGYILWCGVSPLRSCVVLKIATSVGTHCFSFKTSNR